MPVSRVRESDLDLDAPLSQIMPFRSFIRHWIKYAFAYFAWGVPRNGGLYIRNSPQKIKHFFFYRFFSIKKAPKSVWPQKNPARGIQGHVFMCTPFTYIRKEVYSTCIYTNANPREFTRFRALRLSKYQAPGRLQNTTPREFTRFKPRRLWKY